MSTLPLWSCGLIGALIFFFLMFLKMHVGFSMLIGGFVGYLLMPRVDTTAALENMASSIFETSHSDLLVIIPLFIVMGTLAAAGGPISSAFSTFYKWLGRLRGGLAMAAVGSCAAFGAVCGDNIATALTMDKAATPEMRKYGYKDTLSLGSIAAGGNLGILIPPSAAFVVFGFITATQIQDLFISGIIPGILLTVMFWIQIAIQCRVNPELAQQGPSFTWKEKLISLTGLIGILIGFLIVMLGLLFAWFTPHEAGALGALAMTLIGLCYVVAIKMFNLPYDKLTWKSFFHAFMDATKTAAMLLILIFGARYFSQFLTATNLATDLSNWVIESGVNRYLVLLMVCLVLLILGCLMDIWSAMIITMPIFFLPLTALTLDQQVATWVDAQTLNGIAVSAGEISTYSSDLLAAAQAGQAYIGLGFDPLQIGVIVILMIMIGCITPPVGVVVFSMAGAHREVPMYTIFRGVLPFVLTMIIFAVLLIFVPQLSTWLPGLMSSTP